VMKMEEEKKLSSNKEDYLEVIFILEKKNGVARVKDISRLMKVKTSSVTSALNMLSKEGLVIHERYGYVKLTPEGERLALKVRKRHNILFRFLSEILNIDPEVAEKDACGMEHSVSPQTLEKITKFIEFVETCPEHTRPDWLRSFDYFFKTGRRPRCKIRKLKKDVLGGK